MGGDHVVVGQLEPLGHAGAEVLGDDVETGGQAQHEVPARRCLQVDDDGALRQVVAHEGRTDGTAVGVDHGRGGAAPEVTGAGCLDLDHLGAEPTEQLGGKGEGLHLLEGEDADAVERLAPLCRVGVGDVAQLHVMSRPSMAIAFPRMMRYTSSSERRWTICSATALVSGQVESVWG